MPFILPLLILFGLIAAPDAAFSAASNAAVLWWTRVLPSLLPYLIASSLLLRSGILARLPSGLLRFCCFRSDFWADIPSGQNSPESCIGTVRCRFPTRERQPSLPTARIPFF